MSTRPDTAPSQIGRDLRELPLQEAAREIWDSKYRLKTRDGTPMDADVHGTLQRIAQSLAEQEATPEQRDYWLERFLWAMENGAVPAGRIVSNAGAWTYKPNTSTINCTVSGIIHDAMDDILRKVHEAGLTLKSGAGIGYCFSTLRPKGAYVSGAGAHTSGPLSFMDIYDRMCFTISSAGGRRGAQMATFDVGHPDVVDFIRAKQESGRLRQFNCSVLVTEPFMQAVADDDYWPLAFPLTEQERLAEALDLQNSDQVIWRSGPIQSEYITDDEGRVACRIYQWISARWLWEQVMAATYDYAEPGFILIDEVNRMNNNWFCENIIASNPCVTADTWVQTAEGPRQVGELVGRPTDIVVQGRAWPSTEDGFFRTGEKPVLRLVMDEGQNLRLTADHPVLRRIPAASRNALPGTEWVAAGELRAGDQVVLHDHGAAIAWAGASNADEGYLLGLLLGDGTLTWDTATLSIGTDAAAATADGSIPAAPVMRAADTAARALRRHRSDVGGWQAVPGRSAHRLNSSALRELAGAFGMAPGAKGITPEMERASSDFYTGFLRGLFDADGNVQGAQDKGVSVRLVRAERPTLEAVQRMLGRLGIASTIHREGRPADTVERLDGQEGSAGYACWVQHELLITGGHLARFAERVGFTDPAKAECLRHARVGDKGGAINRPRWYATVASREADGIETVYDVQVPGIHAFDANGVYVHNCGEQMLPPYGSCLLGSINLTRFVREPFTENAYFDWDTYREVVRVFTRMLDNVVEMHGLPLEQQAAELRRKRRHGMGVFGLGSALVMLRMRYGETASLDFTTRVTREMAVVGWEEALALAEEKGPAPIMNEPFEVTPAMLRVRPSLAEAGFQVGDTVPGRVLWARFSDYMQRIAGEAPDLVERLAEVGGRFTHHTSIAPTGTIALSLGNNASNGIEPSFSHHYKRNVIREGHKSKEQVDVYSYELLAYRHLTESEPGSLPEYFVSADAITPKQHVDIQAAAQRWVDSSISKTANVPTEFPYEDFKDIYRYAHSQHLKGCTTFRFNPEVFQGVLVRDEDLKNTHYRFTTAEGTVFEVRGDEKIEYEGQTHVAANLHDALKEGYYGRF